MFNMALLWTHKMIRCTCRWQLRDATSTHASHFQQVRNGLGCSVEIRLWKPHSCWIWGWNQLAVLVTINDIRCSRRSCCQRSATLLETCSPSSKIMHQHMTLVKPCPHQQQCRSNARLWRNNIRQVAKTATMSNEFFVKFRPFDKVETN